MLIDLALSMYSAQETLWAFTLRIWCAVCTVKYASPNCLQPCPNHSEWCYLSQKRRQWVAVQKQSYQPNGCTSHSWPWLRAVQLLGSAWRSCWRPALPKRSQVTQTAHHTPVTCLRAREDLWTLLRNPAAYMGKPAKWKQIWREVGDDITLGFWDLWYHFRTEDIRAPGCQVIPTRVHRSALVGIRDQLCLWAGSLSGARHLPTPPGNP